MYTRAMHASPCVGTVCSEAPRRYGRNVFVEACRASVDHGHWKLMAVRFGTILDYVEHVSYKPENNCVLADTSRQLENRLATSCLVRDCDVGA